MESSFDLGFEYEGVTVGVLGRVEDPSGPCGIANAMRVRKGCFETVDDVFCGRTPGARITVPAGTKTDEPSFRDSSFTPFGGDFHKLVAGQIDQIIESHPLLEVEDYGLGAIGR